MIPVARIYQPISFSIGATYSLDEKASHYLTRVLRAAVNDQVILFNGEGGEYHAYLSQINKKSVLVTIDQFDQRDVESPLNIHLVQGIARGEKMDWIIQKAVELGVRQITPLSTERSNVRLDKEREQKRLQHWQGVAVSACEQSGRTRLPMIMPATTFSAWVAQEKIEMGFVLSPHASETLSSYSFPSPAATTIILLIGPEGGFSEAEISLAEQHGLKPLNLGPRVLRTETASVAALAMLQSRYGDLG